MSKSNTFGAILLIFTLILVSTIFMDYFYIWDSDWMIIGRDMLAYGGYIGFVFLGIASVSLLMGKPSRDSTEKKNYLSSKMKK